MMHYNGIIVAFVTYAIMPSMYIGMPVKDDAFNMNIKPQNKSLITYKPDKLSETLNKTNILESYKKHHITFISVNKSRDSSNNFNNIASGLEEATLMINDKSTGVYNSPEKANEVKDADAKLFTYYVKVLNSSKNSDTQNNVKTEQNIAEKLHSEDKPSLKSENTIIYKSNSAIKPKTTLGVMDVKETEDVLPADDIEVKRNDFSPRRALNSGVDLEEPTSRIIVTVFKRSGRYWEPWELNHNICPKSLCTASEENRPKGTGGSVFFNGDIVLDPEAEKQIYGNSLRIRWKRAAARDSKRLWKDGVVPYTFSDILPKSKKFIKKAIAHIEKHTCIRFRRKKLRDDDFIRFISEPGCWSNVGRVGGEQKVSIGKGCERLGTAIHEITHSLGFWHEQARPDRDKYVEVLEENVSPRYLPDFDPINKTLVGSRGFPYDYESVMHYSKKAFTNLGDDTIKVIGIGKKLKMTIGQRDELSNLDIAQLRDMYGCNDKEDDNVTFCPSGWKKNGRSCYKFETDLKYQFAAAARHCEELNSHLLYIDTEKEDKYIKKRLKKKFPNVAVWRTAGKKFGKEFAWYTGDGREPKKMEYTKWRKGHPAGYSSMALVHNKTANRVRWEGVWLGSASQYPQHAYPFICERRARRKCIKGKFPDGRDYRGKLDHTMDGITCQKWSSQYPHSHKMLPYPYKDTSKEHPDGLGDHNYCRNPAKGRKRRPWCFTDKRKIKWQYCDVSICSQSTGTKKPDQKATSNTNTNNLNTKDTANRKKNNNDINRNTKGSNRKQNKNNEIQRDQAHRKQEAQTGTRRNRNTYKAERMNRGNKNSNSKRNANAKERHLIPSSSKRRNSDNKNRQRIRLKDSQRENDRRKKFKQQK